MQNDIESILLSEAQIQQRVRELGAQLAEEYRDKNPVMICILKGSTMFFADLLRAMPIPLTMDFMAVSSYGRTTKSSGEVEIRKDLAVRFREVPRRRLGGGIAVFLHHLNGVHA